MSVLTIADVERIAALAHLDLMSDEKTRFSKQLADILDYAQQLQTKEAAWFMKVTKKALIEAIKPSINLYTARFVEQL